MSGSGYGREGLRFEEGESLLLGRVSDLYELLRAIDEVLPEDTILYLENTSFAPAVRRFLDALPPEPTVLAQIASGTLYPEPETLHLPLRGSNLTKLRELAEHLAEPEICDHLAVYRNDALLLTAHDAGDGEVEVGPHLPDETRRRFERSLGHALEPPTR